MYTDRNSLDEYAYHGVFYRSEQKPKEDGDLIGDDGDMLGDTDTSAGEAETENGPRGPTLCIRCVELCGRNPGRFRLSVGSAACL